MGVILISKVRKDEILSKVTKMLTSLKDLRDINGGTTEGFVNIFDI